MKKITAVVLMTAMLAMPLSGIASASSVQEADVFQEDTLTMENCPDFAEILNLKNPGDSKIRAFAQKYAGKNIEFDGNIAWIDNHGNYKTRYDVLIYEGDYRETELCGPNFQFNDIGIIDLNTCGPDLPDPITVGLNVHIVATVGEYIDASELFIISPVIITEREALPVYNVLEKGSKGDEVKAVQERLIELHYLNDKADGNYGKNTQNAVAKFQEANEIEATGIADPETQKVLFSDSAKEAHLVINCSSVVVGSSARTAWYVDGNEFTLSGKKTKTIKTAWGTYKFDAFGEYEKIED